MKDDLRIQEEPLKGDGEQISEERREFLKKCGRFAAYAAPTMVLILTHTESPTVAGS